MELEDDQNILKVEVLEKRIAELKLVIQHAEKYERMKGDADVEGYIKDTRDIADYHDRQVQVALDSLWEKNALQRQELYDQIYTHQIMKDMASAMADRPKKAIEEAKDARMELERCEKELQLTKEALRG